MSDRPPGIVHHGTDSLFEHFDISNSFGAHFGTREAAERRLRDLGHHRIRFEMVESEDDPDLSVILEFEWENLPPKIHGPFDKEEALIYMSKVRGELRPPLEFELDVFHPLELPDLGTWEFSGVLMTIEEVLPGIDVEYVRDRWNQSSEKGWSALKGMIKAHGYDCVSYVNETEDPGSISWIVMDPERIHHGWRMRCAIEKMKEEGILQSSDDHEYGREAYERA